MLLMEEPARSMVSDVRADDDDDDDVVSASPLIRSRGTVLDGLLMKEEEIPPANARLRPTVRSATKKRSDGIRRDDDDVDMMSFGLLRG
jgi:hypothetical protein